MIISGVNFNKNFGLPKNGRLLDWIIENLNTGIWK